MTAEAALLVRTFSVGKRRVTLTIPKPLTGAAVAMVCEWEPTQPRKLSRREWREYRAGRNAAVAELSRQLGERILLMEL